MAGFVRQQAVHLLTGFVDFALLMVSGGFVDWDTVLIEGCSFVDWAVVC